MVSLVKVGKFNGYFNINDLCDDREALKQFVFNFCKEEGISKISVILDSNDYIQEDGSIDEDRFYDKEREEILEVWSRLARIISYSYKLDDEEEETLFYSLCESEIEYWDNPIITIYDLAGERWPAPEDK